jgi:hypothetical protein
MRPIAPELDTAHHRTAAPVRHHRDPRAGSPVQQVDDVGLTRGEGHHVRRSQLPAQSPDHVPVRLADTVPRPLPRVSGTDLRQRGRRHHPRRPQLEVVDSRHRQHLGNPLRRQPSHQLGALGLIHRRLVPTPTPPRSPRHAAMLLYAGQRHNDPPCKRAKSLL